MEGDSLVETILQSHRALARIHGEEIDAVQSRIKEMDTVMQRIKAVTESVQGTLNTLDTGAQEALSSIQKGIEKALQDMQSTQETYDAMLNALRGREQDFIDNFDELSADFFKKAADTYAELMDAKAKALIDSLSPRIKPILNELASKLGMEIEALGKKVAENTHNAMHEIDKFNEAVRQHGRVWRDQSTKLASRVLVFSLLGGFSGTLLALIAVHFL